MKAEDIENASALLSHYRRRMEGMAYMLNAGQFNAERVDSIVINDGLRIELEAAFIEDLNSIRRNLEELGITDVPPISFEVCGQGPMPQNVHPAVLGQAPGNSFQSPVWNSAGRVYT